jgi:hypothetical protein
MRLRLRATLLCLGSSLQGRLSFPCLVSGLRLTAINPRCVKSRWVGGTTASACSQVGRRRPCEGD